MVAVVVMDEVQAWPACLPGATLLGVRLFYRLALPTEAGKAEARYVALQAAPAGHSRGTAGGIVATICSTLVQAGAKLQSDWTFLRSISTGIVMLMV